MPQLPFLPGRSAIITNEALCFFLEDFTIGGRMLFSVVRVPPNTPSRSAAFNVACPENEY